MLYIEMKELRGKREKRKIFLNGEYHPRRLEREMNSYFWDESKSEELLNEGKVLKQDVILKISVPTVIETHSENEMGAFRKSYLYYRDTLILHSDATYDIKCFFWNALMEKIFLKKLLFDRKERI